MSRRSRRNHSPAFRAKAALAALKGDKTLSELATHFDVHPTQITVNEALFTKEPLNKSSFRRKPESRV